MKKKTTTLFAVVFFFVFSGCGQSSGIPFEATTFSKDAPTQALVSESAPPLETAIPGVYLKPRAAYVLNAYVMSRKEYDGPLSWDPLGELVPVDLALAWQRAASPLNQQALTIRQSGRWYFWRQKGESPLNLSVHELNASMANVHMVPADDSMRALLLEVQAGRCYRFTGHLVDIEAQDPSLARRTSMSRTDSGAGACEILLLQHVVETACPE